MLFRSKCMSDDCGIYAGKVYTCKSNVEDCVSDGCVSEVNIAGFNNKCAMKISEALNIGDECGYDTVSMNSDDVYGRISAAMVYVYPPGIPILCPGEVVSENVVNIIKQAADEGLEVLGFTKERAHEQFGFLLDAFSYGVPPHAGLAYGVDRMIMHMVHADSIRDVIAFPKVKDASDLMSEAPGTVDEKQLEELGIQITASDDEKEE